MSKATRASKAPSPAERFARLKRRLALSLYLAFLLLAAVGSQAPWWRVWNTTTNTPITNTSNTGDDFARWETVKTDDPANPTILVENPMRPAVLALLACSLGFFFASYNLVADQFIHLPLLLVAVFLLGTGGYVFYDFSEKQSVIRDVILDAEIARVKRDLSEASGADVASVNSSRPPRPSLAAALAVRFEWGLSLFLSSSGVLLISAIYMTFFAQRNPAESP